MSTIKTISVKINGLRPLLMHSAAGADPLSDWAKARSKISKIRQKTDEHHAELAELDWRSAFYADENKKPVILSTMLEACLFEGAKRLKLGKVAKAAIVVPENPLLTNHGHELGDNATIDDFWADRRFRDVCGVRVQNSRIMRYRPRFATWSLQFEADLYDMDAATFENIISESARFCGLGDNRPKYGLFLVESIKQVA
jgi:hypothetical protein